MFWLLVCEFRSKKSFFYLDLYEANINAGNDKTWRIKIKVILKNSL